MVYRLVSRSQFVVHPVLVAGIGIAVEAREVRRRDFDADPMSFFKYIAGDADFNGVFIDGTGFE